MDPVFLIRINSYSVLFKLVRWNTLLRNQISSCQHVFYYITAKFCTIGFIMKPTCLSPPVQYWFISAQYKAFMDGKMVWYSQWLKLYLIWPLCHSPRKKKFCNFDSWSILLYSSALPIMMKYHNIEHSIQKVFFLKYGIKGFASDEISMQVSSSLQGQGWNFAVLALSKLTDIPSVIPYMIY
jgi:hypothetical protein